MRIGNTPDQETDITEILNIDHWSEWRRISYTTFGDATRISEWISLEAGRKYYMEAAHLNIGGGSHFSTGVEIEQEVLNPTHPNNMKELQKLTVFTEDKREMHRLTINNPDSGVFRMTFTSANLIKVASGPMSANMDGNLIVANLAPYFHSVGVSTVVVKKNYNAAGEESEEDVVKTVFEISLDRLVSAPSFTDAVVNIISTASEITFEPNIQVSNPPMSGHMNIKCVYPDGKVAFTNAIDLGASTHTI